MIVFMQDEDRASEGCFGIPIFRERPAAVNGSEIRLIRPHGSEVTIDHDGSHWAQRELTMGS